MLLGRIQISNGATTTKVDLSKADTVQDVINSINAAGVGGVTASISGNHLVLSTSGSDNITRDRGRRRDRRSRSGNPQGDRRWGECGVRRHRAAQPR